jgi:L-threonylcarbamoyladenylate synthase
LRRIDFKETDIGKVFGEVEDSFGRDRPVIIPTDTLYGLACPISSRKCIERIFDLKVRPVNNKLAVSFRDIGSLERSVMIPPYWRPTVERILPGPVTILFKAKEVFPHQCIEDGKVAARIPDSFLARELSRIPTGKVAANRRKGFCTISRTRIS